MVGIKNPELIVPGFEQLHALYLEGGKIKI